VDIVTLLTEKGAPVGVLLDAEDTLRVEPVGYGAEACGRFEDGESGQVSTNSYHPIDHLGGRLEEAIFLHGEGAFFDRVVYVGAGIGCKDVAAYLPVPLAAEGRKGLVDLLVGLPFELGCDLTDDGAIGTFGKGHVGKDCLRLVV